MDEEVFVMMGTWPKLKYTGNGEGSNALKIAEIRFNINNDFKLIEKM